MDADGLPTTDPEIVHGMQAEYDQAFRTGSEEELDAARFRLVWAMVHSSDTRHVSRGLELAKRKVADSPKMSEKDSKELRYLAAVGCYRLGKHVEARHLLKELLLVHPDFRQAEALHTAVDNKILSQGLMGVGLGAAVLGVGLAILFGAAGGKR